MTLQIALIADPHLCVQARRRNALSLISRKLWNSSDVLDRSDRNQKMSNFSPLKPTSYDDLPLLAAADFIQEFSAELDLLVILGDLATTGLDNDLEVAGRVFLDQQVKEHLSASLEPRFGGLGIPLHIIPGNHDRYKDDAATPGGRRFDTVFQTVYNPNNGVCLQVLQSDDVSICIVSADFCFPAGSTPSFLRKYGRGAVDDAVLSELEFQTRSWQNKYPGKPVIWALHFSPGEGVPTPLILEQREKVLHQAQLLGVNHIFCGHTHIRKREIGAHPHIYCAGSVSAIDAIDNHFLHICTVSKTNSGQLQLEVSDLKFDEDRDEFVYSPPSLAA